MGPSTTERLTVEPTFLALKLFSPYAHGYDILNRAGCWVGRRQGKVLPE